MPWATCACCVSALGISPLTCEVEVLGSNPEHPRRRATAVDEDKPLNFPMAHPFPTPLATRVINGRDYATSNCPVASARADSYGISGVCVSDPISCGSALAQARPPAHHELRLNILAVALSVISNEVDYFSNTGRAHEILRDDPVYPAPQLTRGTWVAPACAGRLDLRGCSWAKVGANDQGVGIVLINK